MHGSTLWPGIFAGFGGHHTARPMCSHHRAATCAGWGTSEREDCRPPLTLADQAASDYGNRLFTVYSGEEKGVEIHWPDGLRPLHRCPRLLSNLGPRRKMEILKLPYAPYPILLHISWVLDVCLWCKRSWTCITIKPYFNASWQAMRHCLQCKILDMAPSFFFLFPPITIETDGYFFLGVGRAIWLQCLIVIIADSDTLLAGSSLLLRQLPFNKKERGRRGQAQLKSGEFGSLLGPGQAARL